MYKSQPNVSIQTRANDCWSKIQVITASVSACVQSSFSDTFQRKWRTFARSESFPGSIDFICLCIWISFRDNLFPPDSLRRKYTWQAVTHTFPQFLGNDHHCGYRVPQEEDQKREAQYGDVPSSFGVPDQLVEGVSVEQLEKVANK